MNFQPYICFRNRFGILLHSHIEFPATMPPSIIRGPIILHFIVADDVVAAISIYGDFCPFVQEKILLKDVVMTILPKKRNALISRADMKTFYGNEVLSFKVIALALGQERISLRFGSSPFLKRI